MGKQPLEALSSIAAAGLSTAVGVNGNISMAASEGSTTALVLWLTQHLTRYLALQQHSQPASIMQD